MIEQGLTSQGRRREPLGLRIVDGLPYQDLGDFELLLGFLEPFWGG
jgi:hypothetical protein